MDAAVQSPFDFAPLDSVNMQRCSSSGNMIRTLLSSPFWTLRDQLNSRVKLEAVGGCKTFCSNIALGYPHWSSPKLAQVFGVRGPPTFEMGEITLLAFWDGGVIRKRFHRGSTESFIVFPTEKGGVSLVESLDQSAFRSSFYPRIERKIRRE
ncbi:hypothetical protein CDAR_573771 [Caerostris darwini]|uniref:Uncharacterized protein n=1 Tax=Caerostris darwini TaxID=1538125 RepID=A0AAV4MCA4_9ARAC|nr:hypothetical protein CDAR_573771 [Caerostris darwini]